MFAIAIVQLFLVGLILLDFALFPSVVLISILQLVFPLVSFLLVILVFVFAVVIFL